MWEISLQGRMNLWLPVVGVRENEPHSLVTLGYRPDHGVAAWLRHGLSPHICPVVRLWKEDLPRLGLRIQAPDIVIKSEARKTRIEKDPILR